MLSTQTEARVQDIQQRLHERGVVDIKFFKQYPEYTSLSANEQMAALCDVLEAVLDGRTAPAPPLGDSVRSPKTFSPVTRCDGASETGDFDEEQQKGGTTAP